MKKLVEVTEVEGEGLESLLGEQVVLYCLNYIYEGKLVGVNSTFVKLENPRIIYETGPYSQKEWKDSQQLWTKEWYIQINAIESFGIGK